MRPKLSEETIPAFLDWTLENHTAMSKEQAEAHMKAAELVVRIGANKAQAKATQHTLVEEGVIAPPVNAS